MSRSIKKGPFVDTKLMAKVVKQKETRGHDPIKTWSRRSTVLPEFVSHTFMVHNGNKFIKVFITEDMVGHKLGEFALTRFFRGHPGLKKAEVEE
ncbi:MAG TPA: 30S ribosomal protein S19 [Planctomycetota bacterium]|nr:30S ribosomal protein S19 [Planctomycetota bacterium]